MIHNVLRITTEGDHNALHGILDPLITKLIESSKITEDNIISNFVTLTLIFACFAGN